MDVIEGTLRDGPVSLGFELQYGPRFPVQLAAAREFDALFVQECLPLPPRRLTEMLLALQAYDARTTGASLRIIAQDLLGPGDWPGDGEFRKSRARRLVAMGAALVRAGPHAILAR
ncbi:hypothetical protein KC8_15785 [Sphingomonas sp. KC8]|nr:hypothetical protein KC8_15785 [Sphingomonas sp. KC8]